MKRIRYIKRGKVYWCCVVVASIFALYILFFGNDDIATTFALFHIEESEFTPPAVAVEAKKKISNVVSAVKESVNSDSKAEQEEKETKEKAKKEADKKAAENKAKAKLESDIKNAVYPTTATKGYNVTKLKQYKSYKDSKVGGTLTAEDVRLYASLIYAEAGSSKEGYEGKLAVAIVVSNRVKKGTYGDSIRDVIFHPAAFEPVSSGALNKKLLHYDDVGAKKASDICMNQCVVAAKSAWGGELKCAGYDFTNVIYFCSGKIAKQKNFPIKIHNQSFSTYW